MHGFGKAQPALLYLSPGCVLCVVRGVVKAWTWVDEFKEEEPITEETGFVYFSSHHPTTMEYDWNWAFNQADESHHHHQQQQRLPPSLWMSSATPSSPSDSKSTIFTDIFADDFLPPLSPQTTSAFTSPRISGSPDLKCSIDPDISPEQLAKEDPLATQVWKMYARTKVTLPHAQRMENLTWRMMALALKKKKEDDHSTSLNNNRTTTSPSSPQIPPDQRGRRIDKGKARVRVVGFDAINNDPPEQQESVFLTLSLSFSSNLLFLLL